MMTDGMMQNSTITICAVDCIVPELASRAINLSKSRYPTDDAILFSDNDIGGSHRTVIIDKIESIASYNKFLLFELGKYIKTDYVLVVQWDGYITNSDMWSNNFFNYDYRNNFYSRSITALKNNMTDFIASKRRDSFYKDNFLFQELEKKNQKTCPRTVPGARP